jgi:uncharacterized Zn finger protein
MAKNVLEMVSSLSSLLDRSALRPAAGARSFKRGENYFACGQAGPPAEHRRVITANVLGTVPYQAKLWVEHGELRYSCTCPVGKNGAFCKHCVAAGLAWLDQGWQDQATGKKSARPAVTMDDARARTATEFVRCLEPVRTAHKPKRNFMKLLDGGRWE